MQISSKISVCSHFHVDPKDLFTLHEGSSCITHDMLSCNCTDKNGPTSNVKAPGDVQKDRQRPCQLGKPKPAVLKVEYGDITPSCSDGMNE